MPTPVFWPGESCGLYSPWGHSESDTTERLSLHLFRTRSNSRPAVPRLTEGRDAVRVWVSPPRPTEDENSKPVLLGMKDLLLKLYETANWGLLPISTLHKLSHQTS